MGSLAELYNESALCHVCSNCAETAARSAQAFEMYITLDEG
jgi:hypothetical protein